MANPNPRRVNIVPLEVIIIFFLLPLLVAGAGTTAIQPIQEDFTTGFGAACNVTLHCPSDKSLICSKGLCKCSNEEIMTYEVDTAKCVLLDNNSCIAGNGSANNASLTILPPCGKQSKCDPLKGICVPKESSSGHCASSSDCQQGLGLICEKNLCICDPNNTIQGISGDCLGKVDKVCVNKKCASNAECVAHPDVNDHDAQINKSLPENHETSSSYKHVCKCIRDHYPTPSGSCATDFGIDCKHRACSPWLTCGTNGACECRDPSSQIFDKRRASCVAKITGECNANFTGDEYNWENLTTCVAGGECVKNSYFVGGKRASLFLYHCECKHGFVETVEGTCDLAYGSQCKDGQQQSGQKCDRNLRLTCIKGKCLCEQPMYAYGDMEGRCVGLAGASCNMTDEEYQDAFAYPLRGVNFGTNVQEECTEGAKCEPDKTNNPGGLGLGRRGICKCIKNQEIGGSCETKPFLTSQWIMIIAGAAAALGVVVLMGCMYLKKQGYVLHNALF